MIALGTPDVVLIASRILRMDPQDALELVDVPATEEAISEASAEASPTAAAAVLLHGLVTRRPLTRANDRVALVAAMQLLGQNGWELDLGDDAHELVARIRSGELSAVDVERWLASRSRPARPPRRERVMKRAAVAVLAATLIASVAFLAVDHTTNRNHVAALDRQVSTLHEQVQKLHKRAAQLRQQNAIRFATGSNALGFVLQTRGDNGLLKAVQYAIDCPLPGPKSGNICVPGWTIAIPDPSHTNP